MSLPNYLFLCAVGRSGTTIFRRSLGLHPDIDYNGHENNIVQDVVEVAKRNCELKSRQYAMVVENAEYQAAFRDLLIRLIWPERRSCRIRMAAINPTGDLLPTLTNLFPECKSVALVRNGIEVISSRMEYASFAQQSFETHCKTWLRSQGVVQWGASNEDRFQLFRHEWFYDPEFLTDRLGELYDWLDVAQSDAPLRNFQEHLVHPTGVKETEKRPVDWSQQQRKEYFQSKRERWKNWTSEQRTTFEKLCSGFMEQLGYSIPW